MPARPPQTSQEMRWAVAIENAAFGVWDLDLRLDAVHYSPGWKARLGFPRIGAPDSTSFWRCRVHPLDLDQMMVALRSHLDGSSQCYEERFRLRSNGAGYRTVLSRGRVVVRDHLGVATRMVGTMVDLTGGSHPALAYGLVTEEAAKPIVEVPFHALLSHTWQLDGNHDSIHDTSIDCDRDCVQARQQLVESVSDLLDIAFHETRAAR